MRIGVGDRGRQAADIGWTTTWVPLSNSRTTAGSCVLAAQKPQRKSATVIILPVIRIERHFEMAVPTTSNR